MSGNLHGAWSRLVLHSLVQAGVRLLVVSPGSRSTPLALAALETEGLQVQVSIDERAAGFFALGAARASGQPVALLCTSGTAGAHWLPALIEASQSFVPLLAITADRPWEAQGNGSSQTIDQAGLFGAQVRRSFALGLPDAEPSALRAAKRMAAQAVAASLSPVPGPVHLNAAFRKPLEPVPVTGVEPWEAPLAEVLAEGPLRVQAGAPVASEAAVESVNRWVRRSRRGLIVAGPALGFRHDAAAIADLARATGFPLLAEATSGLRFGAAGPICCGAFDAFLRTVAFAGMERPDFVLQLGSAPISTGLAAWLGRTPRVVVAPFGWPDPEDAARELIATDPGGFARSLSTRLASKAEPADVEWVERFGSAERAVWSRQEIPLERLDEPAVVRATVAGVPQGGWLLVSNSRPVRDLDTYVPPSSQDVRVISQRGAAGIDGLISGAAGTSLALSTPGVLLLGDVATAHDASALALARTVRAPLAMVVIDNGGGRIFDELPIGSHPALPRLFTTAPAVDFRLLAEAYGVAYLRPASREELVRDLARVLAGALPRGSGLAPLAAVTGQGAAMIHVVVSGEDRPRARAFASASEALG